MAGGIGDMIGGLARSAGTALGNADWGSIAGEVAGVGAPILGSLLGGVVGGPAGAALGNQAGKLIAGALGVEPTPEAVSQALQSDPEAVEKIKQLEMAHADDLEEIKARLLDVQSARQMQVVAVQANSPLAWVPVVLTVLVLVGFFVFCGAAFTLTSHADIPDKVYSILNIAFGAQVAAFSTVLGYWFGSSRSSETNGAMVRSIAGATTGAAVPGNPSGAIAPQPKARGRKPLSRDQV